MENPNFQPSNRLDKFKTETFDPETHTELLLSWLKSRNISSDIAKNLPDIGFLISDAHRPVVIGFLRQVEGNLGICEGFCTNPEIEPSLRNEANDLMVQQLIETGRSMNLTTLMAWTRDNNTLERSLRHGFVKSPSVLISYDLSQPSNIH